MRIPNKEMRYTLLAIAAVLTSIALLIVAIHNGGALLSLAVIFIFQVIFALGIVILAALLIFLICGGLYILLINRISALEKMVSAMYQQFERNKPAFVAWTGLAGSLIVFLADKTLNRNTFLSIGLGFILILVFKIANSLLINGRRLVRIGGWILWYLAVVLLPAVIFVHHAAHISATFHNLSVADIEKILFLAVALLMAVFAPALRRKS